MCMGPHVENTRKLPKGAFRIRSLAGAYWRGNSDNVMMTRIYAWAFETKEELEAHVKAYKEAQARDHKKLGKDLDMFVIDDEIGKGLPLWLPNGTVVRDELEKQRAAEVRFKPSACSLHPEAADICSSISPLCLTLPSFLSFILFGSH